MAGYKHQAETQYTPEQLARIQIIREMTNDALAIRERAAQAEKRLQERRLQQLLDIEGEVTRSEQALMEAKAELREIQRKYPQRAGVGAKRAALFHREEDIYKAEKLAREMAGASYDMAA